MLLFGGITHWSAKFSVGRWDYHKINTVLNSVLTQC